MRAVTVNIGGRERRLRYDLNAIAEIGDRLKIAVRLDRLGEDIMAQPLPLSAIRTILWAGLIHESPELTEHEVGGWIDTENMQEVIGGFFQLFGSRLPKKDREQMAEKLGVENEPALTT